MQSVRLCPKCGSSPIRHSPMYADDGSGPTGFFKCIKCDHQWLSGSSGGGKEEVMASIDTLRSAVMHVEDRLDALAAEEAAVRQTFAERRRALKAGKMIAQTQLQAQCTHQYVLEQASGVLRYCPTCGLLCNQHEENPLRRATMVALLSDEVFVKRWPRLEPFETVTVTMRLPGPAALATKGEGS